MRKSVLLFLVTTISVPASFAQSFKCPTISYRNNGDKADCPGETVKIQGQTTTIAVNSGLSSGSYSIPTTSKSGELGLEFDQKYSYVPLLVGVKDIDGNALDVEFGPPGEWVTSSKSYDLKYCFYKNNLPTGGKLFVITFNKGTTGSAYGSCTYDGQTLVVAPSIATQPVGQLNICKGSNYTFSCSATASGNNTTLSYQWKKNGTAISGATSSTFALSSVSNSDNGDYTVVVTETYSSGNAIKQESNVAKLLVDAIKPIAKVQNVTLNLDGTGKGSITAAQVDNGSTDACGIESYSLSQTSFDCSHVGKTNTVTLTVTDKNGNVSTADAVVTVKDVTAPEVIAQNVTLNLDGTGKGSITAAQVDNGSTDACGIESSSLSQTSFDCSHVGKTNTVTLTVTDKNGNVSTADAVVTVKDVTSPNVKTKDIEITITNGNDVTVVSNDINDASKDNCGISKYTLTGSKTKFGCSDRGKSFTVTLTAEDASGNSASATANVTVKGTLTAAPSITNDWTAFSGRYFYPYHSSKVKFTTTTKSGYTYSWSGNDISGSTSGSSVEVLPTKEGKLTLTATAKDGDGCVASSTASLCVFDISVPGSNNSKVYVCHNKGSNANGASDNVTMEASISGANNHLTQHSKDGIGVCGKTYDCSKLSGRSNQTESGVVGQLLTAGELSFMVYPNPSDDRFMVEVESEGVTTVSQVRILDMSGRIVETATLNSNVAIEVGRDLIPGIYNIQVSNGGMVSSSRLIKR